MAATPLTDASTTRDELLGRAAALLPAIKSRAEEAESLRRMPDDTVRDIVASGLVRIGNPDRYGGYNALGAEYDTAFEVGFEFGRACGSTAWCFCIWAVHNWLAGHFPQRAQEEFFADHDVIAASAFHPVHMKTEPAPGGMRVSGRWGFSSGSDAASWTMFGFPGRGGVAWFLAPRSDYTLVDDWFVSGMRGTGSKSVVIDDVFVPEYRVLETATAGVTDMTGWELHRRLSYHLPMRVLLGWDLSAPLIGIGLGAVDEFESLLAGTSGRGRTAESMGVQLRLAESAAEVDAARLIQRSTVAEILDKARREEPFGDLERARYVRDKNYTSRLTVQAVNRLFEASGAHSLFESQAMQRIHRDAHGASHQAALFWDTVAESYARQRLGIS